MRQNDLLKTSNGDHLRILLYGEEQSYVVNCQRCKMPFSVSTPSLLQMERLPPDMYRLFALDEDISDRQRQQRDHRAALISPLMVEECIYDKSLRNSLLRNIASDSCNGVQREHNKKLNNGLPILHKVPPKRDYGRYFCIMAEKGGTSHGA